MADGNKNEETVASHPPPEAQATTHLEELAFFELMNDNPEDRNTLRVFMDWLEDRKDPRADGYRQIVKRKLVPGYCTSYLTQHNPLYTDLKYPGGTFVWFCKERSPAEGKSLTTGWFDALEGGDCVDSAGRQLSVSDVRWSRWRDYPTAAEAYDAAARAWVKYRRKPKQKKVTP